MTAILAVAVALAVIVGHVAIGALFVGVSHAFGINARWMNRLSPPILLVPPLASFALLWLVATRRLDALPPAVSAYLVACAIVGAVAVPAWLVARARRALPPGVTSAAQPIALDPPAAGWIGEGSHAGLLRLRGNESLTLRSVDLEIALPALPAEFGDLRILHLSDLHFAPCYRLGFFEAVAEAASGWEADLVLFTGDLLDDPTTLDWTGPVLGRLRGRLGQYAILGNHDVPHRPGRVRRAIRRAGFAILDGRWARIVDGDRSIALGGTSAPWGPDLDPLARPEADATIVLSHTPDRFPRLARSGTIDLVLAGHNHGGQVRIPGIGPILMPSVFGPYYDRGVFRRGSTTMALTQGVGGKHPMRYGCPPEFVRLVLRPLGRPASRVARISDSTART